MGIIYILPRRAKEVKREQFNLKSHLMKMPKIQFVLYNSHVIILGTQGFEDHLGSKEL